MINVAKIVNENRFSPMHTAVIENRVDIVENILKMQLIPIDAQTNDGVTSLMLACKLQENENIVKLLIKYGADVNLCDNTNSTCLHYACKNQKYEVAKMLVQNNAEINIQDCTNLYTPLHYAIENDDLEIVKLLLLSGADTSIVECNGWNPLMLALHDHDKCAKEILNFTEDVNISANNGWTALMHAVDASDKNMVTDLIQHGADVNINVDGLMPVTLAIERDDPELFDYLWDLTAVHLLLYEEELEDFIRDMLNAGWFLSEKISYLFKVLDTDDVTLSSNKYLQILAGNMNDLSDEVFLSVDVIGILKKLAEKGAKLDDVDLEGFATLSYRYKYNYKLELLKILVGMNIPFSNWYVIYALVVNDPEFVTVLLQYCIAVDPLDIFNYISKISRIDISVLKLIKYILCLCTPDVKIRTRCINNLKCRAVLDSNVICYALLLDSLECPTKKYVRHEMTDNDVIVFRKLYNEVKTLLDNDRVPTLKELARDIVRHCLRKNCNTSQEFLLSLEEMHLPMYAADLIRCKTAACTLN